MVELPKRAGPTRSETDIRPRAEVQLEQAQQSLAAAWEPRPVFRTYVAINEVHHTMAHDVVQFIDGHLPKSWSN